MNDPSPGAPWTHTVVSGSDRILIVLAANDDSGGTGATGFSSDVDGAFTQLASAHASNTAGTPYPQADIWYLLNPTVGDHQITPTFSGDDDTAYTSIDLSGVHQTTPFGTPVTDTGQQGTEISNDVSAATGDLVIDNMVAQGNRTLTVGADQTERSNHTPAATSSIVRQGTSTQAGAATVAMSWTPSGNTQYAQSAVAVKPAGGGGGGPPLFDIELLDIEPYGL